MTNALVHMATLLRSGLGPEAVWAALDSPAAREVTRLVRGGVPLQQAVASIDMAGEWAIVRDVWAQAMRTGVPRAHLCDQIGAALTETEHQRRHAQVARASAVMSVRVLAALPPVGFAAGIVMGLDVAGFLWGTGIGLVCFVAGLGLAFAGWRWMSTIVARVPLPVVTTGLVCDVAAVTARAGLGMAAVVSNAQYLADRWGTAAEMEIVRHVAESSRRSGLPIATALAAWGGSLRRAESDAAQLAIEQVPGRLVVPIGVCLFPAFVLLAVVPAVVAMARLSLAA